MTEQAVRPRLPDYIRAANLWHKYKMRPEEYDAMREAQGYRCAICGTHESELEVRLGGRPRKDGIPTQVPFQLVVDHCHATQRVRALLCQLCNAGLGNFREDPERLLAAVEYLAEHSAVRRRRKRR